MILVYTTTRNVSRVDLLAVCLGDSIAKALANLEGREPSVVAVSVLDMMVKFNLARVSRGSRNFR